MSDVLDEKNYDDVLDEIFPEKKWFFAWINDKMIESYKLYYEFDQEVILVLIGPNLPIVQAAIKSSQK
jgi:hypothetical protein